VRQHPQTRQQVRVITAMDDQQALVRGLVHGVILSAALWAAAVYLATILR